MIKIKKKIDGVEAVNKALEIINCFTLKKETLSITEISKITGDYKSRVSRISRSLENYGFLRRIDNGTFKLGSSIGRLIEVYDDSFNFKKLIKDELDFIMTKSNETASFFVKQKNYRTCLITSEPNKPIKHTIQTGLKIPLDKSSSGNVLSAFHNLTIKNKENILKDQFSMSFGERDREIASVSVPVMPNKKKILGSLTITGHISNFNKKNCLSFLNILRLSKIKIEKKLKKNS